MPSVSKKPFIFAVGTPHTVDTSVKVNTGQVTCRRVSRIRRLSPQPSRHRHRHPRQRLPHPQCHPRPPPLQHLRSSSHWVSSNQSKRMTSDAWQKEQVIQRGKPDAVKTAYSEGWQSHAKETSGKIITCRSVCFLFCYHPPAVRCECVGCVPTGS